MQLHNTFTVPAVPDDAFAALLDLGRVAPCMPGAQLTDQDGDTYHGRLKLRIGPITVAYEGTVRIEQADHDARRAQLQASGKELGGQGGASATVVATVTPDGDAASQVEVVTDLDIRGKAAQFGRGAMGDVTQRVLDQFARNLEATFDGDADDGRDRSTAQAAPAAAADEVGLDVLGVVAGPMLRRWAPAMGALLLGLVAGRAWGRRAAPRSPATPMPWCPPPGWSGWMPAPPPSASQAPTT